MSLSPAYFLRLDRPFGLRVSNLVRGGHIELVFTMGRSRDGYFHFVSVAVDLLLLEQVEGAVYV